jgi:hypothetical protein
MQQQQGGCCGAEGREQRADGAWRLLTAIRTTLPTIGSSLSCVSLERGTSLSLERGRERWTRQRGVDGRQGGLDVSQQAASKSV